MEEHNITLKNQVLHIVPLIFLFSVFAGVIYLFVYFNKSDDSIVPLIVIFTFLFLIQLLPQIALHLNYYMVNKRDVFFYDSTYKEITFLHDKVQVKFSLDDISSLTLYKSIALYKNNAQFLTIDNYNHGIIILQNGTRIVITSLMVGGELKLPIPEEKIKVNANLYRWVKGPSLQLGGVSNLYT